MNYSIIIYIIGMILKIEAAFMLLPAVTALIYQETSGVAFLITIVLCLAIGFPLTRKKPTRKAFYTKEGFVTVALSWIVLSIMGAIPFVISAVFRILWMLYLRLFPDLPQQEPVF